MIDALNEHMKIEHEETKRLAYAMYVSRYTYKDFKKFMRS